jgi:IS5 family transposase
MLKAVLLKEWHSLSDKELEEALRVRIDFMVFTGFDLAEDTPDESTICRFRNTLAAKGLDKVILHAVNAQNERLGLKLKKANGAVIESSARPRKMITIENDREESGKELDLDIRESADKDARWLKKGNKSYFGYKGFAVTDTDDGYIQGVQVEPTNVSEITKLEDMLPEVQAVRLYADKGYASEGNRDLLKGKFKDGIMHRAARNRPLTKRQKLINKLISKKRYIIEQGVGTLKRLFRFTRASSMTRLKVAAQFWLKAICFNLLKASNKATVQPRTA